MTSDLTIELLNDALAKEVQDLRGQGKTDEEIADILNQKKIEDALNVLIQRMSVTAVQDAENSMYERVMEERARTAAFLAHNEQIWFKGFVASEAMYLMTLEAAEEYCDILSGLPEEKRAEKQYRFTALKQIHGRACQQYLEILFLMKNGFADGAYARWRSLYELSVIADFICSQGEAVAQAYIDQLGTDKKWPDWAKTAPAFSSHKGHVKFSEIEAKSSFVNSAWKGQHDLSCQLVHASPQGTFSRLGNSGFAATPNILAGHCDAGLALPAVNSAISLSVVSAIFLNLFTTGDGCVFIQTLSEWTNVIKRIYLEIQENCFSQKSK